VAKFIGRNSKVYVGNSSPPVTAVAGVFDVNFDRTPTKADATSNDSGAFDEHMVVRYSGSLSFKFLTDPADSGQSVMRAAIGTTPALIYADYAEEGNASGKKYHRFQCSVELKRGTPRDGMAVTDVVLTPTGTVTEGTY
jgi:hypothetical protein